MLAVTSLRTLYAYIPICVSWQVYTYHRQQLSIKDTHLRKGHGNCQFRCAEINGIVAGMKTRIIKCALQRHIILMMTIVNYELQ
jgi:hypothetical protein